MLFDTKHVSCDLRQELKLNIKCYLFGLCFHEMEKEIVLSFNIEGECEMSPLDYR